MKTPFMKLGSLPPIQVGVEPYPIFNRISIETLSFCNRTCSFCPLFWSQNERGRKRMTDELYAKIVHELGELAFDGVAQMFLLSEPTIDASMIAKLKALRAACPEVSTYASSNGDMLASIYKNRGPKAFLDKTHEFYSAGLTTLNLNVYDEGPMQFEQYREMIEVLTNGHLEGYPLVKLTEHKYSKLSPRQRFLAFTDMRLESQDAAGGTDALYIKPKGERGAIVAPRAYCARPQRHLVIEWDGNVPICCAIDVTDKTLPSMGNINQQGLIEVWNGEPMMKYRYFTQQARRVLPGCSTCTHRMAFPHVVRKVEPSVELQEQWEQEV